VAEMIAHILALQVMALKIVFLLVMFIHCRNFTAL